MEEIINVTIDGDTYRRLKAIEENVFKKGEFILDFGNDSFYHYQWTFYSRDEALEKMAKEYEFMKYKHCEQLQGEMYKLKEKIKELEEENKTLKQTIK